MHCVCCAYRFEAKLPEIFKDIHEAYEQIDARLKAEQFKVHSDLMFLVCYIINDKLQHMKCCSK